ncbi:MAG TPA: hypothetical protein VF269_02855 [Rhodanobacteraceae bacterium]
MRGLVVSCFLEGGVGIAARGVDVAARPLAVFVLLALLIGAAGFFAMAGDRLAAARFVTPTFAFGVTPDLRATGLPTPTFLTEGLPAAVFLMPDLLVAVFLTTGLPAFAFLTTGLRATGFFFAAAAAFRAAALTGAALRVTDFFTADFLATLLPVATLRDAADLPAVVGLATGFLPLLALRAAPAVLVRPGDFDAATFLAGFAFEAAAGFLVLAACVLATVCLLSRRL